MEELRLLARTLRGEGYPAFVRGAPNVGEWLPVFYYHSVSEPAFAAELAHLERNGYRSLDSDTMARQAAAAPPDVRGVALTFDDGLASLYETAFPLLLRHGFKAIAYIVPACVGRPGFVDWDACRRMHESGCVDIQAHSWSHSMVVVDLEITGVWRRRDDRHVPWEVPGFPHGTREPTSRLPLFRGAPLYAASGGYSLPPAFWEDCRVVAERLLGRLGDSATLNERLLDCWTALIRDHRGGIATLDSEEMRALTRADLERCRSTLEERLPGHRTRHFAFPWSRHRPESWAVLGETGYRSGAIGLGIKEGRRPSALLGGAVEVCRLSGDFLTTLPGDGRRGLADILVRKAARRLTGRDSWTVDAHV